MTLTFLLALLCTVVAALPVVLHRRRILLNPAFWLLLTVLWGVLGKTAYVVMLRNEPQAVVHDRIWVSATSADFFRLGAILAVAAVLAYVAGYFLLGDRRLALPLSETRFEIVPRHTFVVIVPLLLLSVAGFLAYLYSSGTSLIEGSLSAKRFQVGAIDSLSRFHYLPYYFFKLALLSGPLAYATAYCLARAQRDRQQFKVLFGTVFVFVLLLCHFASLRLVIGLLLLQVALLLYCLRARELAVFIGAFAVLTGISLAAITLVHRTPVDLETQRSRILSQQARSADAAERDVKTLSTGGRVLQVVSAPLEGRYLLDIFKLAHIAHHFPAELPHLRGGGLIGAVAPSALLVDGAGNRVPLDRYLADEVFQERYNSVPAGYAGELYIDFGLPGLVLGFLCLGLFHRFLYNQLTSDSTPPVIAAATVVLLLNSTLVLVNSGLLPVISRSVLTLGILTVVCVPSILAARLAPKVAAGEANDGGLCLSAGADDQA